MNPIRYAGLFSKLKRRPARLATTTLILASGTFLFAAPAYAGPSHVFSGSFGASSSAPANPYPLLGPTDAAVDQTSPDVYVADQGNRRVEKFDASGNFLLTFGREVNKTTTEEGKPEAERDVCTAA